MKHNPLDWPDSSSEWWWMLDCEGEILCVQYLPEFDQVSVGYEGCIASHHMLRAKYLPTAGPPKREDFGLFKPLNH